MRVRTMALLVGAGMLMSGCDEQCENGYKIKTEYKTIFWDDSWHESQKDTILDGAVRVATWSYKSGRSLSLRCFKGRTEEAATYDIRYSINAPLLKRLAEDLEKEGDIQLIVSVDGATAASIDARTIAQESGIDFLANIQPALIDTLAAAKEAIVVMPRQNHGKLDDLVEFGIAKLRENLEPVKKACASLQNAPQDTPAQEPGGVKDTKETTNAND